MRRTLLIIAVVIVGGGLPTPSVAAAGAVRDFMVCEDGIDCITHGGGRTLVLDQAHGMFTPRGGITGHGTYRIKRGGSVVESGSWHAKRLLSFRSFGLATAEQKREILQTFGFVLPPGSEGGRLILRVHLSNGRDGIMKIDCLLGKPPRYAKEGVRLSILGNTNFNRVVEFPAAGGTILIRH